MLDRHSAAYLLKVNRGKDGLDIFKQMNGEVALMAFTLICKK